MSEDKQIICSLLLIWLYPLSHSFTFLGSIFVSLYEGWNFNSGNYLFTTDTK